MLTQLFYLFKPLIPRRFQLGLRRLIVKRKLQRYQHVWPIDPASAKKPVWFNGWPEGKRFALVITHDVELAGGLEKLDQLLAIDRQYGFRSSVGIVPERYPVDLATVNAIRNDGHEVYVHDLRHDGKLFRNYATFHSLVPRINHYLHEWGARGFRAGAMHHNLDWIGELDIDYDMSTFDTDPFEPMPDGVGTIFPFIVTARRGTRKFVDLPYTLPQDLLALVLHPIRSIEIWKQKIDWIAEHNGMALLNIHPDYMYLGSGKATNGCYRVERYIDFLSYISVRYRHAIWNALPTEVCDLVLTSSINR